MASSANEIIYKIKELAYASGISDDTELDDDLILGYLNTERSRVIREELERNRFLDQILIQSLGCVEIECADPVECCNLNIDSGEVIYRTVKKIPTPLYRRIAVLTNTAILTYIGLITGNDPFEFTSNQISYRNSWRKFTKYEPVSFYLNERVYIRNLEYFEEPPKWIRIDGVFENPDDVSEFKTCEGDACFTRDMDYPLKPYLESRLLTVVIQKYLPYLINRPMQDDKNDMSE